MLFYLNLISLKSFNATGTRPRPLTRLQERLKKKLGANAYPFWFELPPNAPSSVTLQPSQGDTGKPCGADYELSTFVAEKPGDRAKKASSVSLAIRKLTYAPPDAAKTPQPSAETSKVATTCTCGDVTNLVLCSSLIFLIEFAQHRVVLR